MLLKTQKAVLSAAYDALAEAGGLLENAKVQLIANSLLSGEILYADIVHPEFTGEAASSAIVWSEAVDEFGVPYLTGTAKTFSPTNAVGLPVTILGAAIVNAAENAVLNYGYFDAPIVLLHAEQVMGVVPKFKLGDRTQPTFDVWVE